MLYLCWVEDRDFVDPIEIPSLPRHAWIEAQPPTKKERVSVRQVNTDEEYAKILQRKYDNEDGVLFGEESVKYRAKWKHQNLATLKVWKI